MALDLMGGLRACKQVDTGSRLGSSKEPTWLRNGGQTSRYRAYTDPHLMKQERKEKRKKEGKKERKEERKEDRKKERKKGRKKGRSKERKIDHYGNAKPDQ